ncbi:MAG: zinc ABC transporter substrate-binding protein [Gemmobacter sp.]
MARVLRLAAPLMLIAAPALAEAQRVVADIAPVQALVARVMAGAGAPEVLAIVPAGASPHGFSLRPSQAAAIEAAEIVVTIGAGLTPWLDGPLGTLAPEAARLTLTEVAGVTLHEAREAVLLGGDAGHEGHGHAEAEGKHDHEHAGHDHDHDHGPVDPHAWLDPLNAALWVDAIAEALAVADPAQAALYRANAAEARAEIAAAEAEVRALLAPVAGRPYAVFHDAYQYFEARFAIAPVAAIALGDAADPGPQRVAAVRDAVAATGVRCIFAEPQMNPALIATIAEGTGARTGTIDPLGGASYPETLRAMARDMAACLGD